MQLRGTDPSPQDRRAYIVQFGLFLLVDANVIAVNIIRSLFIGGRIELESDSLLQFVLEAFCRPSMFQEQKLQSRPFAVFAKVVAVTENLCDALERRQRLVLLHERIQPDRQMRISGQASPDAEREACLPSSTDPTANRRQTNIVNFRILAPHRATADADLEFTRQVHKFVVADKQAIRFLQKTNASKIS